MLVFVSYFILHSLYFCKKNRDKGMDFPLWNRIKWYGYPSLESVVSFNPSVMPPPLRQFIQSLHCNPSSLINWSSTWFRVSLKKVTLPKYKVNASTFSYWKILFSIYRNSISIFWIYVFLFLLKLILFLNRL